ncbi:hypothetical protein B0A52_05040 [Exophiala mesophila]|uniref:PH domain-like protein n=1 Tax=Exophiala mesophila TaxID=212818 RepID=A0A438N6R8_EXOME|nr:hypothetical protein B0A52_05040 [Exophiala mesophila]
MSNHHHRRSGQSRRQQSVDYPRYPPVSSTTQQPPTPSTAPPQNTTSYANFQPPPQPPPQSYIPTSDYESDFQGYQSEHPPKPPPIRSNEELNLSVLKRHNSSITGILSIAPYAVVYEFSPVPEPQWTKTGVEGSLFICELSPGPYGEDRYSIIILNRRGLDNFEAELREGEDAGVEITGEYVILSFKQSHQQKIYGVYIFHDGPGTSTEHAQDLNGELMKKLADHAGASRQAAEAAALAAQAQHTNGHVREAEASIINQSANAPNAAGQQISLQQLFGQQRADDSSWSVRVHNMQQAPPAPLGAVSGQYPGPPLTSASQPPDVLGDLFRRAGLGAR